MHKSINLNSYIFAQAKENYFFVVVLTRKQKLAQKHMYLQADGR